MKTLVLNKGYQPIGIISSKKAFLKVYTQKAESIVDYKGKVFKTPNKEFKIPSIIRCRYYNNVIYRNVPLTKRNIYKRDSFICGYTGVKITNSADLSIDHIIPKSKGGATSWTNLVTSHKKINEEKGDYILGEDDEVAHLKKPKTFKPHFLLLMQKDSLKIPEEWKPYLYI